MSLDVEGILGNVGQILELLFSAEMGLQSLLSIFTLSASILQMLIMGIGWIGVILGGIFSLVLSVAFFIIKAIPVYKIARKNGCKWAWLAWIPWLTGYLRTFVLMDATGNRPFTLFNGKWKMERRWVSYLIWLGICLIGPRLLDAVQVPITSVVAAIPFLGVVIAALIEFLFRYVISAAAGFFEFAYLRDILSVYNPDQKKNQTMALVVIILDALLTNGWARTVILYLQLKKKPLPVPAGCEEAAQPEAVKAELVSE